MSPAYRHTVSIYLIGLLILGCSQTDAPTMPGNSPVPIDTGSGLSIPSHDQDTKLATDRAQSHNLWGFGLIYIDPTEPGYEIIPVRQVANHWNILSWLESGPCTDCFGIAGITPSGNGTLLVDIEITHPFPSANLTGFDVRGIAMFSGSQYFPTSGLTTPDRDSGDGELVNADGYTTLYNPFTVGSGPGGLQGYMSGKFEGIMPDAELNGYKRHITADPSNTRNALYADTSNIATYEVDMPDSGFVFGYAVDASWVTPDNKPVTDPMNDFPPEANCPEPWKIEVTEFPIGSGLTDIGGQTTLRIDVYDWSGKDSHSAPRLECNQLFNGNLTATWSSDDPDFTRYEVVLENTKLAGPGEYECLVRVEDDENASAPDWLDLTAYQIVTLDVIVFVDQAPVPIVVVDEPPYTVCETINFNAGGSHDPDGGNIVSWEWDWENDGTWDDTGETVGYSWDEILVGTQDTFNINLRVTDDEGTPSTLPSPIELTIGNIPPTPILSISPLSPYINETVTFDCTASHDNDCGDLEISWYSIDFENDGEFDDTNETGIFTHAYFTSGLYEIGFKVRDDEDEWAELEIPLEIYCVEGWAETWGGADGQVYVTDVGYISSRPIVAGYFSGTVDFDPGEGEEIISSSGGYDAFLAAFDFMGKFRWVFPWGSTGDDKALALLTPEGDEIYVTGSFTSAVNFDPDFTSEEISNGQSDVFVAHYTNPYNEPLNLDLLYVASWGGSGDDEGHGLAEDPGTGDILVTGFFENSVDFDPGLDVLMIDSNGASDVFVNCMDGDLFTQLWAVTWGGIYVDEGHGINFDETGDWYVTGEFIGTVDFNPDAIDTEWHSAYNDFNPDVFLVKYTNPNTFTWTTTWGGSDLDVGTDVAAGEIVYVTGYFDGSVDFDPEGTGDVIASTGGSDGFLRSCDTGEVYNWCTIWGGTDDDRGNSVEIDDLNQILVTGSVRGEIEIELAGGGNYYYTSEGLSDVILGRFDLTSGDAIWVNCWGSIGLDTGSGVIYAGDIFACGNYAGTVDFNTGEGVDEHTAFSMTDGYIVRYPGDGEW